ncbi:MAG: DUF262 domain-containing protein [Syntrophomonadaceae bacterium]|nr:DUF262 domain-containing protein [Syntrophomonadaceae bacterium]
MKIATILDHIDSGHMALPEFQRGYVWNREQVRGLFESLYRRHPVGGLLVWVTESDSAQYRGDGSLSPGVVQLILDGQQRVTSLYGVVRGKPPKFFDGNKQAFTGLYFNLETETFNFYQPMKMQQDPLWIDVSKLMKEGSQAIAEFAKTISERPEYATKLGNYLERLSRLLSITDTDLHVEQVTGADKTLDVVVDIFNRVNSGGTKLSKGDLALAKICADWPEARMVMKSMIEEWSKNEYYFNLDWLLRSINTILTGEAKFSFLHGKSAVEVQEALKRAYKAINICLNLISSYLGLDHDRVLFGRYAIPVMVRYIDQKNGQLNAVERDKLLFWYLQAGMWGRFSGSTETYIDQDLAILEREGNVLDKLIEQIRLWHGTLKVEPGHFSGWSLGARFYPVLYMLTRIGVAKDWGLGIPLKKGLLGKMNKLEIHHIFPKAQLYKARYSKPEVNALANFCFLTKDTNLSIGDRLPEEYFPEIEAKHPGALASQWIPMDKELWKIENYPDFLAARGELLAEATNEVLKALLHGDTSWLEDLERTKKAGITPINIGIADESEEALLSELNTWVVENSLSAGELSYEYSNEETGEPEAIFDLAWPSGLQQGLTQPVTVLLGESPDVIALANKAGFRCFTDVDSFKNYVKQDVLKETH